jgi:hypothetical protein
VSSSWLRNPLDQIVELVFHLTLAAAVLGLWGNFYKPDYSFHRLYLAEKWADPDRPQHPDKFPF